MVAVAHEFALQGQAEPNMLANRLIQTERGLCGTGYRMAYIWAN